MDGRTASAEELAASLHDPRRADALVRSGLLDSPPDDAFDRATRLATRHLRTPVALVSIVDDHRQFFKSSIGLSDPWDSARETPLSHSFCQHVVATSQPLVVGDSRLHPVLKDNGAVEDLTVIAYAGVPLRDGDGNVLGSMCAIDSESRAWSQADIEFLTDLAEMLRAELRLRAALEAAEELEHRRSDMLAVLAHDLRSPMSVISGMATMLDRLGDRLTQEQRVEFVAAIDRNATNASELLDRLLTLEGRPPEPEPVAFEVRAELRHAVLDQGERVVAAEGPAVEAVVDATMFRQILGNLVRNALVHAGDEATVTLDTWREGDSVVLQVSDDGVGIPEQDVAKVFHRFSGVLGRGGHGLGLDIVRRLTEVMGGTVQVTSKVGEGTTFTVTLPSD